MMGENLRIM
jgi:hypothetical protein